MGNNKKLIIEGQNQPLFLHGKPITRRDFLSAGAIPFAASMTFPTVLNMLANASVAEAQAICVTGSPGFLPITSINLAGGAAMGANFVASDAGGQPLKSHNRLGLGNVANIAIQRLFKNQAPFGPDTVSGFAAGVKTGATMAVLDKSIFIAIPVQLNDDTSMNKLRIDGIAKAAGVAGSILPVLGQNRNADAFFASPARLNVSNFSQIEEAIRIQGAFANMSDNQKKATFKLVENLTRSQVREIANYTGGEILSHLIQCATGGNSDLVRRMAADSTDKPDINPVGSGVATAFNINANSNRGSREFVLASMMYNVIKGNAATANIELGGYDYHDNTTGYIAKDQTWGVLFGQALRAYANMGISGMVMSTTDGATGSAVSDQAGEVMVTDRGGGSMIYLAIYDHDGTLMPKVFEGTSTRKFQANHFTAGQVADPQLSGETAVAVAAMQWLAATGKVGLASKLFPSMRESDILKYTVLG